jgi:hypothetical protein
MVGRDFTELSSFSSAKSVKNEPVSFFGMNSTPMIYSEDPCPSRHAEGSDIQGLKQFFHCVFHVSEEVLRKLSLFWLLAHCSECCSCRLEIFFSRFSDSCAAV